MEPEVEIVEKLIETVIEKEVLKEVIKEVERIKVVGALTLWMTADGTTGQRNC